MSRPRRRIAWLTSPHSMAAINDDGPNRPPKRADRGNPGLTHAGRALLLLTGTAVCAEAVLWIAGGLGAAAVGAAAIAVTALIVARYVGGADTFDGGYRKPVRMVQQREPSLQGWASAVEAAMSSGPAFERVFRPELERLYAVRLAERHGVSMHAEPERAAELVGPDVWAWIDPRRPEPPQAAPRLVLDRRALAGQVPAPPPEAVLEALVRRLETL
ncbi:MAG TPA: hypothetical protein VFU73_09080 [Actinocrinis sp.]|nr:hypothetical protein [Actinocrinis sp.]